MVLAAGCGGAVAGDDASGDVEVVRVLTAPWLHGVVWLDDDTIVLGYEEDPADFGAPSHPWVVRPDGGGLRKLAVPEDVCARLSSEPDAITDYHALTATPDGRLGASRHCSGSGDAAHEIDIAAVTLDPTGGDLDTFASLGPFGVSSLS